MHDVPIWNILQLLSHTKFTKSDARLNNVQVQFCVKYVLPFLHHLVKTFVYLDTKSTPAWKSYHLLSLNKWRKLHFPPKNVQALQKKMDFVKTQNCCQHFFALFCNLNNPPWMGITNFFHQSLPNWNLKLTNWLYVCHILTLISWKILLFSW